MFTARHIYIYNTQGSPGPSISGNQRAATDNQGHGPKDQIIRNPKISGTNRKHGLPDDAVAALAMLPFLLHDHPRGWLITNYFYSQAGVRSLGRGPAIYVYIEKYLEISEAPQKPSHLMAYS